MEFFSHFEVYNAGNGPAIEVETSLLNEDKSLRQGHRESFLRAGDPPIRFSPVDLFSREESTRYIVSEYQSILFSGSQKTWYQTWLPFRLAKSSTEDKINIVAGELEFKEVNEKDRIDAFTRGSKPK